MSFLPNASSTINFIYVLRVHDNAVGTNEHSWRKDLVSHHSLLPRREFIIMHSLQIYHIRRECLNYNLSQSVKFITIPCMDGLRHHLRKRSGKTIQRKDGFAPYVRTTCWFTADPPLLLFTYRLHQKTISMLTIHDDGWYPLGLPLAYRRSYQGIPRGKTNWESETHLQASNAQV